jgi:hypothetical protein
MSNHTVIVFRQMITEYEIYVWKGKKEGAEFHARFVAGSDSTRQGLKSQKRSPWVPQQNGPE